VEERQVEQDLTKVVVLQMREQVQEPRALNKLQVSMIWIDSIND